MEIRGYADFTAALRHAGFSMGGGNSEGIYAAVPWGWNSQPPYETPVRWHTGDAGTDPWEWRIRVLDEERDIAYAKVFFKKSGFITREWYPHFLAARREGRTFAESYAEGRVSFEAKRIYDALDGGVLPLHLLKEAAGFPSGEAARFDRALVELQMGLYLTMCGRMQKLSKSGEEYGWSATVFCTAEQFWGDEVFRQAAALNRDKAAEAIAAQILRLNPDAPPKKVAKFICG